MPGPYTCPVLSFTTKTNKVDLVDAAHINAVQTEIAAINNRMLNAIDSDGTILSGTAFPSPATLTSQQFWRTDLNVLYIWTGSAWSPQSGLTSYTAGDYRLTQNPTKIYGGGDTSYVLKSEIYIVRSGTLRIKFWLAASGGATASGRIYRNGAAVGTERTTTAATGTQYSEDISGWAQGDLVQLYLKISTGAQEYAGGAVELFSGVPTTEEVDDVTYRKSKTYTMSAGAGIGVATLTGLGSIGDIVLESGTGGATTTLYVKTGAATWTAK